jgi:hypothetical protein
MQLRYGLLAAIPVECSPVKPVLTLNFTLRVEGGEGWGAQPRSGSLVLGRLMDHERKGVPVPGLNESVCESPSRTRIAVKPEDGAP